MPPKKAPKTKTPKKPALARPRPAGMTAHHATDKQTKPKGTKIDPLALLIIGAGWAGLLVQRVLQCQHDDIFPARLYNVITDAIFGDKEGDESALWLYLLKLNPAGLPPRLHQAIADLVECLARISADLVVGIAGLVMDGKENGSTGGVIFKACRSLIDDSLDRHGLESRIQAVIDA